MQQHPLISFPMLRISSLYFLDSATPDIILKRIRVCFKLEWYIYFHSSLLLRLAERCTHFLFMQTLAECNGCVGVPCVGVDVLGAFVGFCLNPLHVWHIIIMCILTVINFFLPCLCVCLWDNNASEGLLIWDKLLFALPHLPSYISVLVSFARMDILHMYTCIGEYVRVCLLFMHFILLYIRWEHNYLLCLLQQLFDIFYLTLEDY